MTSSYRYIGKVIPRKDATDIVTGKTKFLDDLKFPDLLHGKVLRSPHPHAMIKSIDKTKAERLKGVKAILTWQDIPDWKGGMPRITRILDKKVRFVGDAVALVAAETEDTAKEALALIEVDYEVLPAVFDVEDALKPGAPRLYDELSGNVVTPGFPDFGPDVLTELVMGDVEKGFKDADVITEGTFAYENIPNPIPPEPPGAVAIWEEPNNVTLWVTSQSSYFDKFILSDVFDRQVEIRTHGGPCGGSYGSKRMSWQVQAYAALLSRATGRPVKLFLTKEEHIATFTLRPGSRIHARVGMKRDGTVTSVAGEWFIDTGYHSTTTQAQVAVGCGEAQIAVRSPNWNLKPTIVCTNRNASGMVRGFGGQELKSTLIPLLCLAMEKAGLDPFEVLKKNFVQIGDGYYWRNGRWYTFRGIDYTKAMDKGALAFDWKKKWRGWLKPTAVSGAKRRGVGVGVHGNADIGEDIHEAYVRLHPDGSAVIVSTLTEHGTGQRSNFIKMAAEVLQLPLEKVSMTASDSMFGPFDFGPAGSRGTYAIGSAIISASEDALRKLLEFAAPILQAAPEDLDTLNGVIYVRGNPEQQMPWAEMGWGRTITGFGRFEPDFTLSNCMMSFVEVEVDTETGKVTLLHVINATDAGQIIDPQGLEGQLNGCLGSAGIDSALFEETVLDPKLGRIMNANMIDYKWRTFAELPKMEHVILETPFPSHRFKAIGVGEISTSPGPSAVLMAVSNALGAWIYDYPLTPDKVLKTWEMAAVKEDRD